MSEYKRLTNNNSEEYDPEYDFCIGCKYFGEPNGCNRPNRTCSNYERFIETYNRLAELEDKIENGTLREVPCKVGDTIYFDTYRRGDSIGVQPHKVARVRFVVGIEPADGTPVTDIPEYEFGKSVFFTAEEAEAKLKKVMEEIK